MNVLVGTPDTYHTVGLERDRHLDFYDAADNLNRLCEDRLVDGRARLKDGGL